MISDLMLRNAVKTGLEWATRTWQPEGALVSPRGAYVILGDRGFEFGVGTRGVEITIVNAGGAPVDKSDRLAVERVVSELGFGVVAHEGFTGETQSDDVPDDQFSDDFGRIVVAAQPHPSLLAAVGNYARTPHRSGPAAVSADFTRVLEAECERLRDRLAVVERQLAATVAQLRASGGVR